MYGIVSGTEGIGLCSISYRCCDEKVSVRYRICLGTYRLTPQGWHQYVSSWRSGHMYYVSHAMLCTTCMRHTANITSCMLSCCSCVKTSTALRLSCLHLCVCVFTWENKKRGLGEGGLIVSVNVNVRGPEIRLTDETAET